MAIGCLGVDRRVERVFSYLAIFSSSPGWCCVTYGMGLGGLAVDAMAIGCLGVECRGELFFVLSHFELGLLCLVALDGDLARDLPYTESQR